MATLRFDPEPCPFIGQPCEYVPMAHRMVRLEKEIERLRELVNRLATALDFESNYDEHKELARVAQKESE